MSREKKVRAKKTKKRKIAWGWKVLICLLLVASLGAFAGPWLQVRIDSPYAKDATIDEFLGQAGVDTDYVLNEMIQPELRDLNEELIDMTDVGLDNYAAMELSRVLLSGEYKFTDLYTILEDSETLAKRAERVTRTLSILDEDMREIHETLVQVRSILDAGQIGLSVLAIVLLLLLLLAIGTVLGSHRFGMLPYVLLVSLLAGSAYGMRLGLNAAAESYGDELLTLSELSFPFSFDRIDMGNVFRVGYGPVGALALAVAALLIAILASRKVAAVPQSEPAVASDPFFEPAAASVAPAAVVAAPVKKAAPVAKPTAPAPAAPVDRTVMGPAASRPAQTTASQPARTVAPKPAPTAAPKPVRAAAPLRSAAATAAGGWVCPKCGARRAPADKFCTNCGSKRPENSAGGWICPKCGARRAPEDKFCMSCGTRRVEPAAATTAARPVAPTAPGYAPNAGMRPAQVSPAAPAAPASAVTAAPAAPVPQAPVPARTQNSDKDTNSSAAFKDLLKAGVPAPAAPAPAPTAPVPVTPVASAPAAPAPAPTAPAPAPAAPTPAPTAPAPAPASPAAPAPAAAEALPQDAEAMLDAMLRQQIAQAEESFSTDDIQI